jgi:hypothetical protein
LYIDAKVEYKLELVRISYPILAKVGSKNDAISENKVADIKTKPRGILIANTIIIIIKFIIVNVGKNAVIIPNTIASETCQALCAEFSVFNILKKFIIFP